MRTTQASLTLSLLLVAAACSRSPNPEAAPAPMPSHEADNAGSRAIPVQVDNQNFSDMNIYLVRDGARWLIGNVGGLTKNTIKIPASLAPPDLRVVLLAQPVGGRAAVRTPTLIVPAGQQVYWTIGSDPSMSTASAG
jgi:hypothetical protein